MPLAGKSSGSKESLRPGVTQSHRGRAVRNFVIAAALCAFGFMFFSNALNPKEEALPPEVQQAVEFQMENGISNEPKVEAAPANPFDIRRVATLPSGFEGTAGHNSLLATAEATAAELSTYSSKQTPEAYVATIHSIDNALKAELLASSKKMWPEITKANISVSGADSGIDPIIREYNDSATLATVEVVVKQTISNADGTTSSQTRAYFVNLVGMEEEDRNISWIVGGFQKQ